MRACVCVSVGFVCTCVCMYAYVCMGMCVCVCVCVCVYVYVLKFFLLTSVDNCPLVLFPEVVSPSSSSRGFLLYISVFQSSYLSQTDKC